MKKLLFLVIVITAIFIVSYQMGWIKQADIHDQIDLVHDLIGDVEELTSTPSLTQFVPADTFLYMGGELNPAMYAFMADYPIIQFAATDRAAFYDFIDENVVEGSPTARFIEAIITDYTSHVDGSLKQFMQHYGLADEGEYAMYMHGLVPVMNLPVADSNKLKAVFTHASDQAGFSYETSQLGDAQVMRWKLDESPAQIVLATTSNSAVLTLSMPQDDEVVLMQRLAQTPVDKPITASAQSLSQHYQYTPDLVSLFDLVQLTKGLFKADDSTLSKDIAKYVPDEVYNAYFGEGTELKACQTDIINLVSAAPRFVMGYKEMVMADDAMTAKSHGVWELTSDIVKKALMQMQGVMPSHTTTFNDQIFSLGLALDMAKLAPATTTLWQAFIDSKFTCESLQQAQQEVKQVSPMMLGMITGFTQGLKGMGLSVYDLHFDPSFETMPSIDAAWTIEADNPSNLLSLLQMMPETAHITVPNDGSVVPVDVDLPFDLSLNATIQGQHLVFFAGEKGAALAQSIGAEPLTTNALGVGGVLNYKKLVQAVENNELAMLAGNSEMCMEGYAFVDQMHMVDMELSSYSYASDNGYEFDMDTIMHKPFRTLAKPDLTGTWKAAYLDETCQWVETGTEKIAAKGTGIYVEYSDSGECELYKTSYNWRQRGQTLVMTDNAASQSRDSCADQWSIDEDNLTLYCELMQVKKDSFMCIYHGDGDEPFVYRYTR